MQRENLNIITQISFYIALAAIVFIPVSLFSSLIPLNDGIKSIIKIIGVLIFLFSVFGIPLSIVSMFSKENLAKRIVSLLVNVTPLSIVIYALIMEYLDKF